MAEALLEIDFQGWILNLTHDRDVVAHAHDARRQARTAGNLVVCLRYLAYQGPHADPYAPDVAFPQGLEPNPGDLVMSKWSRDTFDNPDLADNLRLRGIDQVLLTDHAVQFTARSATQLGFAVTVAQEACAGSTAAAHQAAVAQLAELGVVVN